MQRWHVLWHELMPGEAKNAVCSRRSGKSWRTFSTGCGEEWAVQAWQEIGRKPHYRSARASAAHGLGATRALIERLAMDRSMKRLCGLPQVVPGEAIFSRAIAEFSQEKG